MTKSLINLPGAFRTNQEGVFDGDKCIFMAPPYNSVPSLMESLFTWLNTNKETIHPLILSCVFHYEFVFIHPFQDGNGRMARFWQNAILGLYDPIFYFIPIESYIKEHQGKYYESINLSNQKGSSNDFILFMLEMILKTLNGFSADIKDESFETIYVKKLLLVMKKGYPMSATEIMEKLGLKSKESFRKNYLSPAIKLGLVDYEIKDKPTSRNQRYIKLK